MLHPGVGVLKTCRGFLSELLGHSRRDMLFTIALASITASFQAVAILALNQFVGVATAGTGSLSRGEIAIAIVAFSLWFALLPSFAYLVSLSSARMVMAHRSQGTGVILRAGKACWARLSAGRLREPIAPEDMGMRDLIFITSRLRGMNLRLGLAVKSLTAVMSSLALLVGLTVALLVLQPIIGVIAVGLAGATGFTLTLFKGRQMVAHQNNVEHLSPRATRKFTDLSSQFLKGEIEETVVMEQADFARSNKALQSRFTTPDLNKFLMGAATSASLGIVTLPLATTGLLVFSPTDFLLLILVFLAFMMAISGFAGSLTGLMRFIPLLSLRNSLLTQLNSCADVDGLSEIRRRIGAKKADETEDS